VGDIINDLKRLSPTVRAEMFKLVADPGERECKLIESRLQYEFETALYEGNISPILVPPLATMLARSTVLDIHLVMHRRGGSVVVRFLCYAPQRLHQMVADKSMHDAFAEFIECLIDEPARAHASIRDKEHDSRLPACLKSSGEKGLLCYSRDLENKFMITN